MAREPSAIDGSRATDRGLAHDLRNLLTAIDGHAQLARAAIAEDHPARDDLDEVLAAASRAHQLTVAWLEGTVDPAPQVAPLPLDDLVRGFLPLLAAVGGPGLTVELRLGTPELARISRLRLERVLLNLCLNARDAMAGRGTITISSALRPGGWLEVAVHDTGPGIDSAVVERLFDPDADASSGPRGHGLGLATSRTLLVEAGGSLEVESRPGAGTTMRAVLLGV